MASAEEMLVVVTVIILVISSGSAKSHAWVVSVRDLRSSLILGARGPQGC